MTLQETNITMTRGDTETLTVRCSEPFCEGDEVTMPVREDADSPVELQKTVTEFGADGEAVIVLDHEDTAALPFGTYRYDIQVTRATGAVRTLVKPAKFTLTEEITYDG